VIATLQSVEDHIGRMMETWGGVDAFKDCMPVAAAAPARGAVPINGPKLDTDSGHATQDEIDKLFGE
jgi:chemotaxis protein CheZ